MFQSPIIQFIESFMLIPINKYSWQLCAKFNYSALIVLVVRNVPPPYNSVVTTSDFHAKGGFEPLVQLPSRQKCILHVTVFG